MKAFTTQIKRHISIIMALACAGTFFSILGPAPGYENLFKFLMTMTLLLVMAYCLRVLATIRSKSTDSASTKRRHFNNIIITEVCK